ncbi:MAG: DUF72 domain-containing protein [Acidimicrobiales bacterium]
MATRTILVVHAHRALPAADEDETSSAHPVAVGSSVVRVGTTSWADRDLINAGTFYPRRSMTARQRLEHYCARLSLAEVTTTYRFPPTPEVSAQWAARTPPGFVLDVRAWSLLSSAPTLPDSLWPDLHGEVSPEKRDNRRLYPGHLSADGLEECWARFAHALEPLRDAGRLGVVVFSYPGWFRPGPPAWRELFLLPQRLPGCQLAVELPNRHWFEEAACETPLAPMEEQGLGLVCVDGPSADQAGPPVLAATASTALLRLRGRRGAQADHWTPYRYSHGDLESLRGAICELASSAHEVHVVVDGGSAVHAAENALALNDLLAG